jgi:threonine dehydrogenase-like Zn-dependent dehydrogenase
MEALHFGPQKATVPSGKVAWIRLRPIMSGICGSDLSLLTGSSSPYLAPFTSFPAVLGHEIVAEVDDDTAPWSKGTVVVVDPSLSCAARGLDLCESCRNLRPDACENRAHPELGPGLLLGFNRRVPGGWSERMWAPTSQVIPVPEAMSTRRAVLTEPTSITHAALRQVNWHEVSTVLVIGAGTIGLLTTALLHDLHPNLHVVVRGRYPSQATLARELGAEYVLDEPDDGELLRSSQLDPWTGPPMPVKFGATPFRTKGFDLVIDAVGNRSSLSLGLGVTRPYGQLLLIGGAGEVATDWTPIWARQLRMIGSYGYGENGPETFRVVLNWLQDTPLPLDNLVTHQFRLSAYRQALETALHHQSGAIKVVFTP